jgi:hypothetical protein
LLAAEIYFSIRSDLFRELRLHLRLGPVTDDGNEKNEGIISQNQHVQIQDENCSSAWHSHCLVMHAFTDIVLNEDSNPSDSVLPVEYTKTATLCVKYRDT